MGEGGFNRFKDRMRGRFGDSGYILLSPDRFPSCVTNEDIYTLKTDWLTDNVIAFWEEYLEREFLVNYQSANIVLLRPSMSFMLLQTPDPRTLRDVLPDFTKTSHIFLPINDCRNVNEAEGGTHWSLLLVSVVDGVAFHYDSLPPGNCDEALQATQKLSHLLNKQLRFINLDDSPVQENSSDCGVFVCLHMRHLLLKRLLMANSSEKISMSLRGMRVNANNGRKEIVRIIERFRKKGQRRRSLRLFGQAQNRGLAGRRVLGPFILHLCRHITTDKRAPSDQRIHAKACLGISTGNLMPLDFRKDILLF
ncbi:hypothetical protein RJZ90_007067 [Blastomyces dermatitidis]